jgi:phosphoglycerol transferase MdoB-like AlkP superfamily enzyme
MINPINIQGGLSMVNTLLPIIGIIAVAVIAFKFFGSIVKGILTLALIVVVIKIGINMTHGTPLLNAVTPKIQTQVQQTANQELNTVLQKLKGMNTGQVEIYLQNAQSELAKHGLSIDAVKEEWAKYSKRL